MRKSLGQDGFGRPLLHHHEGHGEQDTEHETDDLRRARPGGAAERGHENETVATAAMRNVPR